MKKMTMALGLIFALSATILFLSLSCGGGGGGGGGIDCIDLDGDGYGTFCALGEDCDDNDRFTYPDAPELGCDGKDNNCNVEIDEAEDVEFAADKLGEWVKDRLGLAPGDTVINSDFCGVDFLDLSCLGDVTDIHGMEYAIDLTHLELDDGQISDISPLSGLTKLKMLKININQIEDLQPLVDNEGIGDGDTIDVSNNPLDYESCCTDIPALEARGATVECGTACDGYTCL
jgi:hypothetical protein